MIVAFTLVAFLGTFILGVFLYYAARPMYNRVSKQTERPRLAAAAALVLLALPITLLFSYTAAIALGQLGAVSDLDLARYQELVAPYVAFVGEEESRTLYERLVANPGQLLESGQFRDAAREIGFVTIDFFGAFLNVLLRLFIAVSVAYYLLRDDDRLIGWVDETFQSETMHDYGRNVDADLQTVFFGNILTALLTGTIGAVVLWLLSMVAPPAVSLPVPILLGLLIGVASLIPIVGMKIILVPLTLYLTVVAVTTDPRLVWFPVAFFVVTTIFVDIIPDLLLRPYVSGRDLHVGLVMFAYILGPILFGWYGLFLGPMVLVLVVHFLEIVVPQLVANSTTTTAPGPSATSTVRGQRLHSAPRRDSATKTGESGGSPADE